MNGFPTTPNAYQSTFQGGTDDAFLVHTDFLGLCDPTTVMICTLAVSGSNSELIHFASQAADVEGAEFIFLALDGQTIYRVNGAQFDTLLPVAPGSHTATVTFHSVNAANEQTQQAFTVTSSGACPSSPTAPSLTICSPLNAVIVKGTVNITIQASDATPPNTLNLSIDGQFVAKLSNQNGTYTHSTTLAAGPHTMSVRGIDPNHQAMVANAVFRVK